MSRHFLFWTYVWRSPLLRSVFVVFTSLVVVLPLCFTVATYFRFISYVEHEAELTTIDTSRQLFYSHDILQLLGLKTPVEGAEFQTPHRDVSDIEALQKLGIVHRMRLYNAEGLCVFSTEKGEVTDTVNPVRLDLVHESSDSYTIGTHFIRASSTDDDQWYVTVHMPVKEHSRLKGTFEVTKNITVQMNAFYEVFRQAATLMVGVLLSTAVAFFMLLARFGKVERQRHIMDRAGKRNNARLREKVQEQLFEILIGQDAAVKALAGLVEYNDLGTAEHLTRMRRYTLTLAAALAEHSCYTDELNQPHMGFSVLAMAAMLHDIGKVIIPEGILTKPGGLTSDEFAVMKKHPLIAGYVLNNANQDYVNHIGSDSYLALAAQVAMYHHERWDGKGYPEGLKGLEIPLAARIVSLGDVYDALRSERPYKTGWSHQQAMKEIVRNRGTHFDPVVVDAFIVKSNEFSEIWEETKPEHDSMHENSPTETNDEVRDTPSAQRPVDAGEPHMPASPDPAVGPDSSGDADQRLFGSVA